MVINFFKSIRDKIRNLTKSDGKTGETLDTRPQRDQTKRVEAKEKIQAGKARKRRPRKPKKKPGLAENVAVESWDISQFEVPPAEGKTRFHDYDLPDEIMHAIADLGYRYCTPIQSAIMPAILAGKDASGQAQTGTGKTAAFLVSILTNLLRKPATKDRQGEPRVLILGPTRELVIQLTEEAEALAKYCDFQIAAVFGGMDYDKQRRKITDKRIDIIVATPGRMIDYMQHKDVNIGKLEVLVIDEADRMLDMGFIPQVRRIIRASTPKSDRQTLLFSATLSPEVMRMASNWTTNQVVVEVEPEQVEVGSVEQIVYLVTAGEKKALLYNLIMRQNLTRVIVFCNRKSETRAITDMMRGYGINSATLSGDVPQKKRITTLEDFRAGKIRVLVATDVAGRGIHVEGISHVINYTLPNDPENYVHRIGRTGRAGATGISVSFACEEDSFYLPAIEEFMGHSLSCTYPDQEWLTAPPPSENKPKPQGNRNREGGRRRKSPKMSRPKAVSNEK